MSTPSPAEVARTLLRGRLPGTLWIGERPARQPGPDPLHHATDPAGRPLVLLRDDEPLARSVRSPGSLPEQARPLVTLAVEDQPPLPGAPSLGQVRVCGQLRACEPAALATVVDRFAESNPVAGLLDVGRGAALYTIDVAAVSLEGAITPGRPDRHDIDLAGYAAARPDPLHDLERDLLLDLADHHAPQVESYFRFLLAVAGIPCCGSAPRAVRLDRYGFVVDVGGSRAWVRLNFHHPVHCRHELAHLLHPVLTTTP